MLEQLTVLRQWRARIGKFLELSNENRWQLLQLRLVEKRIVEAVAFLRENKIEPILIKGWAAAQYYPEPSQRSFSDTDLMIAPEDYDAALKVTEQFRKKNPLDLHKGTKNLDSISFENLFANTITVECGESQIRVLRPEDHLRALCVHWLLDGGAKKERLWDIYYLIKNRPADFDWNRCLDIVGETRRKWIVCTVGLAHRYLGLEVKDTPIAEETADIPDWLIKAIEKEWASDVRLTPLKLCLRDRKELYRQIKKRFPPNPIQATVDMEGEFDERWRLPYQISDIFLRLKLSFFRTLKN